MHSLNSFFFFFFRRFILFYVSHTFFILELNMEGGKEVTPFGFPLIFVLAAVVPSRRLQALIIIICLGRNKCFDRYIS